MGASSTTTNIGLPQFADADKPTWRGDVNSAFEAIDAYTGDIGAHALRDDELNNPDDNGYKALLSALIPAAISPITGWFHVSRFPGADPTGLTDSTAAVQAAIDAAATKAMSTVTPNEKSGTVYVDGVYRCNGSLTPKSNVHMIGINQEASRLIGYGTTALFVFPNDGTSATPKVVTNPTWSRISLESNASPVFSLSGTSAYNAVNSPRFTDVRFWQYALDKPCWDQNGNQVIAGTWDRCYFEFRAGSSTTRPTVPLFRAILPQGNIFNSNTFRDCWMYSRYSTQPAFQIDCTNGGYLWHNTWNNIVGEYCQGGLIWLTGCAGFSIDKAVDWDTDPAAIRDGHLFKLAPYGATQNFCSGEISRSYAAPNSGGGYAANMYDIYALDSAPTSTARKGIKIIDCDPTRTTAASIYMNGGVEVVGRTKPFKLVTTSPYTIGDTDPDVIVVNSASAFTLNIPASLTALFGRRITIKNIGAGVVTIPQSIDGGPATTLNQWDKRTIVTDGANAATGRIWFTV